MSKRDEFLREQKILRLATLGKNKVPHIVPVWYRYSTKRFHIGTNTKTQKARNVKRNRHVSFCVDVGVNAPGIYGVMGQGTAELISEKRRVRTIAKKILARYYKTPDTRAARELLDDTDCIIEITPTKFSVWNY